MQLATTIVNLSFTMMYMSWSPNNQSSLVLDNNVVYNITFGDNEPIVTAITKTYYNNSDLEIILSLNDLVSDANR